MTEKWTTDNIPDMTGKVAIVTGANSGIGFETVKALAEKGAEVVLACRNLEKANVAVKEIRSMVRKAKLEIIQLDLADLASVRKFAESFKSKYQSLDFLINNAGIMIPPFTKTEDGFEVQFGAKSPGIFCPDRLANGHYSSDTQGSHCECQQQCASYGHGHDRL